MRPNFLYPVHPATPLTIAVLESGYYNEEDQQKLINSILEEVFRCYSSHYESDDLTEFLLSFRTRIKRMITKYEFYGVPFEHYLMRIVRLNLTKYRVQQRKQNYYLANSIRYNPELLPPATQSVSVDILPIILNMLGIPVDASLSLPLKAIQCKRLLIVSCKLVHWLTDDHVRQIAHLTGRDYEQLLLFVETVRALVAERFTRHCTYVERRNKIYARLLQEYCDLRRTDDHSHGAGVLHENSCSNDQSRLSALKQRLQWYNKRTNYAKVIPTNQIISTVLDIPKGTVDNIVVILKKKYTQLSNADNMRYAFADEDSYRYK